MLKSEVEGQPLPDKFQGEGQKQTSEVWDNLNNLPLGSSYIVGAKQASKAATNWSHEINWLFFYINWYHAKAGPSI